MEQFFNTLISFSYDWAESLVNGLWLGILLAGLIYLWFRFGRRPDGATGYAIWWSVLLLIAFMPLLLIVADWQLLPSGKMSEPVPALLSTTVTNEQPTTATLPAIKEEATPRLLEPASTAALHPVEPKQHEKTKLTYTPPPTTDQTTKLFEKPITKPETSTIGSVFTQLLPAGIFLLWLMIATALLARIGLAALRVRKIKRLAVPLDLKYYPYLKELFRGELHRRVTVAASDMVDVPMAAGLGAPMVLVPADLLDNLSPADLKAILLHEMAHLRRFDDWTKLAQKVVEAVLFFHPAVIWIGRQLDIERELACDDAVIDVTGRPSDYARCLTRLAQASSPTPTTLMPGALSGREQIFHRIARLLRPGEKPRMSKARMFAMIAALVVTLILSLQVVPVIALPNATISLNQVTQMVALWADADDPDDKETTDEAQKQEAKENENDSDIRSYRLAKEKSKSYSISRNGKYNYNYNYSFNSDYDYRDDDPAVVWTVPNTSRDMLRQQRRELNDLRKELTKVESEQRKVELERNIETLKAEMDQLQEHLKDVKRSQARQKKDDKYYILEDGNIYTVDDPGYLDGYVAVDGKAPATYYKRKSDKNGGYVLYNELPSAPPVPPVPPVPNVPGIVILPGVPSVPGVPAPPSVPSPSSSYAPVIIGDGGGILGGLFGYGKGTTITTDDDGRTSVTWSDGRSKLSIETDGEFELTDDGQDIKSISRDGYVSIYHRQRDLKRELDIEAGPEGQLVYDYEVDGEDAEFDAAGKAWFHDILLDLFRKAGFAAQQRAALILKNDGVDGVLDEIEEIESDYVTRLYMQELIANADVNEQDQKRLLDQIDRYMESDYEKAEMLIYLADHTGGTDKLLSDYVAVLKSLDSDYETRRVLTAIGIDRKASKENLLAIMELADEMDSDYEKAELLIEVSPQCRNDAELTAAYTKACGRIDSDYELRRVLDGLGRDSDMNKESLAEIIAMAELMDSDYEKAELLIEFSDKFRANEQFIAQLLEAAATLTSDYETRRVLEEFNIDCRREAKLAEEMLRIASRMNSDYEKSQLLQEWSGCARTSDQALQSYLDAVDRISSDYERRQVLDELIDSGEIDEKLALSIIRISDGISSDYDRAQVLSSMIELSPKTDQVQKALEEAVESLGSDYERDKLYRKLYRKSRSDQDSDR